MPWRQNLQLGLGRVEESRSRCIPCVNGKNGSSDAFGFIAQKELDGVGYIIRRGKASKGATTHDLLALLVTEAVGHFRLYKTWRY